MLQELIKYIAIGGIIGYFVGMLSEQTGIGMLLGAILAVLIAIYIQINNKMN